MQKFRKFPMHIADSVYGIYYSLSPLDQMAVRRVSDGDVSNVCLFATWELYRCSRRHLSCLLWTPGL